MLPEVSALNQPEAERKSFPQSILLILLYSCIHLLDELMFFTKMFLKHSSPLQSAFILNSQVYELQCPAISRHPK